MLFGRSTLIIVLNNGTVKGLELGKPGRRLLIVVFDNDRS